MKQSLRQIFWFILRYFEQGDEPYHYKPLSRKILLAVGALFIFLFLVTIYLSSHLTGFGYLIPAIVFFAVGFTCLIVGLLGSDRAIAKIWGNRN